MTDPDAPESLPTVQPVWVQPGGPWRSFNHVPGWERVDVVLPFPWRVEGDPQYGVRCRSLWANQAPLAAGQVFAAACDGWGGFRFKDEGPREGGDRE